MKKSLAALVLLALLAAVSLWHVAVLGGLTGELQDLLTQAEDRAEEENWSAADALTREALRRWKDRDFYLHVTLQHRSIDEVDTSFGEVLEFIELQEAGEYSAANARLVSQLRLLGEAERPSLENLL